MDINEIPTRSSDGNVNVFVEIPKDSQNKYEYDEDLGVIVLDRTLHSSVHYPTDYGFVPRTRGADGEPLDTMVIVYKRGPVSLSSMNVHAVLRVRTTTLGPKAAESQLLGYNDV